MYWLFIYASKNIFSHTTASQTWLKLSKTIRNGYFSDSVNKGKSTKAKVFGCFGQYPVF